MAVSATVARKLLTAQEWTLIASSRGEALKALPPSRLKAKVARARTLRNKYRSLERQQAGEARGKRKSRSTRPAQGNQNTTRKTQIFAEALERYQRQLEVRERAAARKPKSAGARQRKSARTPARPGAGSAATSSDAKAQRGVARAARREAARNLAARMQSAESRGARKAERMDAAGKDRIQAHAGSRGRRRQTRRDVR